MMAIYTYRADGLRHSKTVNGVSTVHVWKGNSIVLELDGSGAIINRFDRSLTGRLIRGEHHGYYLHNKRGDVVQRVNAQGQILRNYRYTAFGVELNPDENNGNPFRFAGEYWDAETGTYYLRARSFNPRLGRFTQPDWHWNIHNFKNCNWSILQAGNLYVFTMNNPIRFIDPLGLYAVMLRYIVEKNRGTMRYAGRQNLETHRWEIDSINVRIGEISRLIAKHGDTISLQDGHWMIDSSFLMSEFGLTQTQATHQPWDKFSSMDTAAIAFGLMHTQRSTDMGREIGAMIYAVSDLRGNHSHYTFGRTWVGGPRDVILGLALRIRYPEGSVLTHSMVALAHTHPVDANWFSRPDTNIAHGGYNILRVPTMPVFMSVNFRSGGMEVRRYDNTMERHDWGAWGRLIFSR